MTKEIIILLNKKKRLIAQFWSIDLWTEKLEKVNQTIVTWCVHASNAESTF